jgi:hypothetical protein
LLAADEINRWRDTVQAEEPAALADLAIMIAATVGMMMLRSVPIDVNRANTVLIVGQAMREYGVITKSEGSGRRDQAQRI